MFVLIEPAIVLRPHPFAPHMCSRWRYSRYYIPLLIVALLMVGLPTVRWVGRLRVLAEACTVSPAVLFMVLYPQSTQELGRIRYADLIREATQERLAKSVRDDDLDQPDPSPPRRRALHWVTRVARGVGARPAAGQPA